MVQKRQLTTTTVSSVQYPVSSRGGIYDARKILHMAYVLWRIAKEKVAATFSKIRRGGRLRSAIVPVRLSIPDNGLEEWENGQRANSCCYRSHSGLLNTVTSNKRQVSSLTMNSLPANLAGRDVTMLRK